MAIPVIESFLSSTSSGATSTNIVLTKPSGVVSGDFLVLIAGNDQNNDDEQFSDNKTGWNFVASIGDQFSDSYIGIFTRVSDGTEGSSETVVAADANEWCGFYLRCSPLVGVDVFGSAIQSSGSTQTIPEITTTVDDTLVLYGLAMDTAQTTPFSVAGPDWSEVDETASGTGTAGLAMCFGERDLATAGLTSDAVVTASTSNGGAQFQISLGPALEVGPIVTTPTSGTNDTNLQSTGTDLDTVTGSSLKTTVGGHSIALNITAQTTTTINEDMEAGVNDAVLGTPANGVPLFAQLLAAGSTPYQLQHEVTDGSDANALNFQLNPDSNFQTVQAMIATTNQNAGEGFGDPFISTTEDDEVWRCPNVVDGVNITLNADLTVTVDDDKLITIIAEKWAPSTGEWSVLQYTRGTSVSAIVEPIIVSIIQSIVQSIK